MEQPSSARKWLVAAWPGMGNVAVIAAGYMAQKLSLKPVVELAARGHFDVQAVEVKDGVIGATRLPRSLLFRGDETGPTRGLTVFLGEAQPAVGSYAFANALIDRATDYGVDRVVTFASMASQLHPSQQPRVFGAATRKDLLDEFRRIEVTPMGEGQIAGLNGVLLGACAERGIPGLCLLGEIPYFAAGVANPKAAKAVLEAYALLSGVEIDLEELGQHAETVDQALIEMLERLKESGQAIDEDDDDEDEVEGLSAGGEGTMTGPTAAGAAAEAAKGAGGEKKPEPSLDPATKARIERMFKEAAKDRSKAVPLKQELDRLGVFGQFEDRFLDLFKRAE